MDEVVQGSGVSDRSGFEGRQGEIDGFGIVEVEGIQIRGMEKSGFFDSILLIHMSKRGTYNETDGLKRPPYQIRSILTFLVDNHIST